MTSGGSSAYDDAKALERDQGTWGLMGTYEVRFERVDRDRIRELEPLVARYFQHGVFVPDGSYVEESQHRLRLRATVAGA